LGVWRSAEVAAAIAGEEDVLRAPHHALGVPGGAAGVEDVEVVRRSRAEVALGRRGCQRAFVIDRADRIGRASVVVRAVVDRDVGLEVRERAAYVGGLG